MTWQSCSPLKKGWCLTLRRRRNICRILAVALAVIVGLCSILVSACAASGEAADASLTVGVPADRCPIFYRDAKTGEIVGIGADLMRASAEAAGYSVTFKFIEEETLQDALDNDAYDLIMPADSAVTSSAGQPCVVSENLIQMPFTLVSTGSRGRGMPPLDQLKVAMLRSLSDVSETVRQLFPDIEITLYDTMDECAKALNAGEVDALLHSCYEWSYFLQKPAYARLTIQPYPMFNLDFRAAAPDTPDGRAIIERLNGGIANTPETLKQSVLLDYTTRRLYRFDISDLIFKYGLVMGLGALLFVSLVVIVILRIRSKRTKQGKKKRDRVTTF